MDIYYYVLHANRLVAMVNMVTIYMVNFVKMWRKSEEKGYFISPFYNIDHRLTNLVCICRSTTPLFEIAILPNIRLICLSWQPHIGLILSEKLEKIHLTLPFLQY